jgi:curli production assembly/transport component CsgG
LTPLIYAGSGVLSDFGSRTDIKIQYGLGVEYLLAPGLGFEIFAEQNITFNDELDEAISGKRDDYYFNFGAGLTFYLSPPDSKNRKKRLGRKNSKEEKKSRKLNKKIDSNKE